MVGKADLKRDLLRPSTPAALLWNPCDKVRLQEGKTRLLLTSAPDPVHLHQRECQGMVAVPEYYVLGMGTGIPAESASRGGSSEVPDHSSWAIGSSKKGGAGEKELSKPCYMEK